MRRASTLAMLICCACTPRHAAPAEPVSNTTAKPSARATNPLGLDEGVTWRFTGTRTVDNGGHDVTTPVALTTEVIGVERIEDRTIFTVTGWPGYDGDATRRTVIVIDRDVVWIDGEKWFLLDPIESVDCRDDEYCWSVEPGDGGGFDVYYRTGPDVTVYHLDPGRGVTDFTYHHNGTTDDLELRRD